ncbi:MAG: S24/S26 family peptidase [Clostridia bacterium]|nr:S24/S26 family peptidase [Clostridia bacterium]
MENKTEILTASMDELVPVITERLHAGQSVCFSPKGISMLPMLRQGIDTVTLSPLPEKIKKYDIPLYRRDNGKYVLHRIVKCGETCVCIGDNQFAKEYGIRRDQLIAVVSSFTRGGKEYSVNHFGYKLYCRFWHYTRFPRRAYRAVKRRIKALFS